LAHIEAQIMCWLVPQRSWMAHSRFWLSRQGV
jgi:hypothetical protein